MSINKYYFRFHFRMEYASARHSLEAILFCDIIQRQGTANMSFPFPIQKGRSGFTPGTLNTMTEYPRRKTARKSGAVC